MGKSILILALAVSCYAQLSLDPFNDNGPLMKSLADHVIQEHNQVKDALDNDTETFYWTLCNLQTFSMLTNQCKIPFEYSRLRSLDGKGSVASVEPGGIVYVGTKYWYVARDLPDTTYYRIVAYKFRELNTKPKSYVWKRVYDAFSITCRLNQAVATSGRFYY